MESIILSRRDFREFDQIISLYTKEKGKMELLARGVKKVISKNTAHLEPCSYVQADIVPGKEIDHLIRVQPINFFSSIRQHVHASLAVQYGMNLFDALVHVHEPDQRLFHLLKSWLRYIDQAKEYRELLLDSFVLKLFSLLGVQPILDRCVVCEKPYSHIVRDELSDVPGENRLHPGFYVSAGGIICQTCRAGKEKSGENIVTVGMKEVGDMEILLRAEWVVISRMSIGERDYENLHRLVYQFAVFHSERRIGDWARLMKIL